MIRLITIISGLFFSIIIHAQNDTSRWVRAFPITNYIVDLTDSIKLVQLYLPAGPVLKNMQPGMLRGVYHAANTDTLAVGSGRLHLVKGEYYYFTVRHDKSSKQPRANDLLYTVVNKPAVYEGLLLRVASHYIELQDVYETPFFDRNNIFLKWSREDEDRTIDSMVADIQFTGQYVLRNESSKDLVIQEGPYKGKRVLTVMVGCTTDVIKNFLRYVVARPRLYAGRQWKISEIFATWLHSGAPTVE